MEEDDFINIRPPQATISAEKSHRQRNSNSKRDRQVFVGDRRRDERPHDRDHQRNRQVKKLYICHLDKVKLRSQKIWNSKQWPVNWVAKKPLI